MRLGLVLLAAGLLAAPCAAQEVLFGCDYLPSVSCVEDFSPYWLLDKWSVARSRDDLRIMRAIGCASVRLRGLPETPDERHLQYLDAIVPYARETGLSVHLCIGTTAGSVDAYVRRHKGQVASYQFGDGLTTAWDAPATWASLQQLLDQARRLDPKAQFAVEVRADVLARMRREAPGVFAELDVVPAPVTDDQADVRGWIAEHVQLLPNIVSSETSDDYGPFGANGSYGVGHTKEVWVTGITAGGSPRWGNWVNDGQRAEAWPRLVHVLATAPGRCVTRIYYHCFRDNLSGRALGRGQCGLVRYDGTPDLTTVAFQETAQSHARPGSLLDKVRGEIDYLLLEPGQEQAELQLAFENVSAETIVGAWTVETPPGMSVTPTTRGVRLQPQSQYVVGLRADVKQLGARSHHIFARLESQGEVRYAWGVVCRPEAVELDAALDAYEGVAFVPGIEAAARFLDRHGDDVWLIAADTDMARECAYRLRIVLESMTGVTVPLTIGVPEPEDENEGRDLPGMPAILVGPTPYGPQGSPTAAAATQGWLQDLGPLELQGVPCPAALAINGRDDAGLRAVTYNLIRRLWLHGESEATGLRLLEG